MPLEALLESQRKLLGLNQDLQARLAEATDALRAFSSGEVDAIVSSSPEGDRVYTLKGADETYRVMVQEMAEGALTLTRDGLILFSNQQFAAMLGCPLEQVIGARMMDFAAGVDAAIVSGLIRSSGGGKAEVRLSSDGVKFVPVYLSVRNVVLDGTECQCLIVTDLSAQKRYEELLAVMEAVPVGVFIAQDPECRTVLGNGMAYELLHVPVGANLSAPPPGQAATTGWRGVRDGKDIPVEELPIQVAARTGQPVRGCEFDIQFDDGIYRSWLGNAVPLFDELQRPRGAVGAFLDITDRKRAEETLAAANTELRLVASALANGLQEPLNTVLDFTRLLAQEHDGKLGEKADKYLAGAVNGALRMEILLQELLRYWEVTGRSGDALSPVDCNRALSHALLSLEQPIQQSHACVTSDSLPTVVADEVMLTQVFRNLIGNSIRYRGKSAPQIHVSAVRAGERWLFSVRDNGIGIERADTERAFDMFSSLHKEGTPGTGIGLALCRKVVERHGGRIWVESVAGRGASFRFTLPIYLDSALPDKQLPTRVRSTISQGNISKGTISK